MKKLLIRYFWLKEDQVPYNSELVDWDYAQELIVDWLTRNPQGKVDFILQ